MALEIRPIDDDEFPSWFGVVETAFGSQPTELDVDDARLLFDRERSLAVFDGGAIVATASAYTFDLTVPGGAVVGAGGATAVGVLPTHRRRGLLTALMDRQLDDMAARGEPVAVLTASESSIYGRFGFGPAASYCNWQLPTEGARLLGGSQEAGAGGQVRLVDADEAIDLVPDVYDETRLRHAGALSRPDGWWDHWFLDREEGRDGASAWFFVVHDDDAGETDGYAAYRVRKVWERGVAQSELIVTDLHALDDEAEAALWRYLLAVDLVTTVHGLARPVDEPLRWRLADSRRLSVTEVFDHLWLRVLDVPAALAARDYGTDDAIVLELTDALRPVNDGRYEVQGAAGGSDCAPTRRPADLALDAPTLGALYLGGVTPTVLARAGRIEVRRPGALERADAFFAAGPAPWCNTDF